MTGDADNVPLSRVRFMSDIVDREITKSNSVINARIEGIEHGIATFRDDLVRVPTAVDRAILSLRELLESVIKSNANISYEHFLRVESSLQGQKDAAGETQKSSAAAISKAEKATSESITQLQTLFQTSIAGLSTQISDVKSRLDKGEGSGVGHRVAIEDNRIDKHDSSARMFAIIAMVVSAFIGMGEVWSSFRKDDQQQMTNGAVQRLQADQLSLAKNSARTPVEKNELDSIVQRMDALSNRLNSIQSKP